MVAFFRYSPINILTVFLPPSMLEFNSHHQQEWIRTEAAEVGFQEKFASGFGYANAKAHILSVLLHSTAYG